MQYMGGKTRLASSLVPIFNKIIADKGITAYWEPFVGGANIIDKIKCEQRIGSDNSKYLIALFKEREKVKSLLQPFLIDKRHYLEVKTDWAKQEGKYEDWYIGAIGFFCSYNGRFFDGGYAGLEPSGRNRQDEKRRNFLKQLDGLNGVEFIYSDYRDMMPPHRNTLIYCDPPYENTTKYYTSKNFDHKNFWDWCREQSKYNITLISEQQAPEDFTCIWKKQVTRGVDAGNKNKATEKLFIHNSLKDKI